MNLNDRVAWELGRALVRALTAESQRDEVLAQLTAMSQVQEAEQVNRNPRDSMITPKDIPNG